MAENQTEVSKKIDIIMSMIMSFRKEVEAVRRSVLSHVEQCSESFQSYVKKTEEHQRKFEHVFKEIQGVQRDLKKSKSLPATSKPINEIKINGLPKNLPATRLDAVIKIFTALQIPDLIGDVINTREFVNKNNTTTSSIVVTMKSDVIANYIVNKSRKKRGLASSELFGFGGESSGFVYLNEFLPPETFHLYMKVRQARKKGLWKSVWHEFGRIYVQKTEKSNVVQIREISDLNFV